MSEIRARQSEIDRLMDKMLYIFGFLIQGMENQGGIKVTFCRYLGTPPVFRQDLGLSRKYSELDYQGKV